MILRTALVLAMASLIVAPSPGQTGGCGATAPEADAADTCLTVGSWECVRAQQRGELDAGEEVLQACVDEVADACATAMWPLECQPYPLQREVDACVEELMRADRLDTPSSEIPECDFCP